MSDDLKAEAWRLTVAISNLRAENEALRQDAERLDWLEKVASLDKVELAKSLLHTGFEIGEWPSMRVTMRKGTLRDAIDAARKQKGER